MVKTATSIADAQPAAWVYLLHFPDRTHYVGFTRLPVQQRVRRHRNGTGSKWVRNKARKVGKPVLAVTIPYPTLDLALRAEKRFKADSWRLKLDCPHCHPLEP